MVDIPQLLSQSATILTQFQGIIGKADALLSFVNSGQGNIGLLLKDDKLYTRVDETVAQVNQIVKDIRNSNGTISKLIYDDQLYQDIRRPIQRMDDLLAQLQAGKGSAGKLLKDDALYDEARLSITEARKMLDDLNAGKGTAGKLLKDEELYNQVNQIMAKLNAAVDKINAGQGTIGQLVVNPRSLQFAERHHPRSAVIGEGYPRQSQEVPAHQARAVLIRLAVNADDFGFTRDVNEGIVEAHRRGILTSTTLMANGDAFAHAVQLARANPTLDVGCHLTLIGGDALTGGRLPGSIAKLVAALAWDAFRSMKSSRRRSAPSKRRACAPRIWIRTNTRIWRRPCCGLWAGWRGISESRGSRRTVVPLPMPGFVKTADRFLGFRLTGRMGPAEMEAALRTLKPGFTEFMCHPGYCRDELRAAPTRLKESRERELEALVSPQVRRAVEELGIVLTPFG